MAWNFTFIGCFTFHLLYSLTTIHCFSVECLVSSQFIKCVDWCHLHFNPFRVQSVIKFLSFVIILIWAYLRFSWSYLSLQLSYLWTVKLFSDRQKGREGWSQCLRELKIDPGTVIGPAMWSGGRTNLTSDDVAVSGDGKCYGFHKCLNVMLEM